MSANNETTIAQNTGIQSKLDNTVSLSMVQCQDRLGLLENTNDFEYASRKKKEEERKQVDQNVTGHQPEEQLVSSSSKENDKTSIVSSDDNTAAKELQILVNLPQQNDNAGNQSKYEINQEQQSITSETPTILKSHRPGHKRKIQRQTCCASVTCLPCIEAQTPRSDIGVNQKVAEKLSQIQQQPQQEQQTQIREEMQIDSLQVTQNKQSSCYDSQSTFVNFNGKGSQQTNIIESDNLMDQRKINLLALQNNRLDRSHQDSSFLPSINQKRTLKQCETIDFTDSMVIKPDKN